MKYSQIRIALLTFTLGIASVPFFDLAETKWSEPSINLPEAESKTLVIKPLTVQQITDAGWMTGGVGCGGRDTLPKSSATKKKKDQQIFYGQSSPVRRSY